MVWATDAKDAGSSPTGGILAIMCVRVMHLHIRFLVICPLWGSNLGRIPYSQDAYPSRKTVSWATGLFPHDLPGIADQSLGINGHSFWALISAKDGLFSGPPPPDIGAAKMR